MTSENKIISTVCSSREAFLKLLPVVDQNIFTEFGLLVFKEVIAYYDTDSIAPYVDTDLIKQRVIAKKPKQANLIEDFFASLPAASSADNILRLYQDQQKAKLREELIIALGSNQDSRVSELIGKYQEVSTASPEEEGEEVFNGTPVEELEKHFTGKNLIPIYPSALSDTLGGGVPRQSQLCIFARPDVGKTVVAINAAVGAAERGHKVLYVGNEDPSSKMMFRILTRFARRSEAELRANPKQYYEEALKNGYRNFFFVPMHPGTPRDLRKWIEKIKPDLVVIDQIRNMNFDNESMTLNLDKGCRITRGLAKEFNLVMLVITQAGESAHNKPMLDYDDVEYSNTGVAGQMDLMIGVGQTADMKEKGMVMLSIPKNKFTAPIKPILANIEYHLNRLTVTQIQ